MHTSAIGPNRALGELCKLDQWVCWQLSERPGKKPAKPPISPRTGTLASTTNPATWGSYELALAAKEEHGYHGIGFMLTADDAYTVIDLDGCIDRETSELEPWATPGKAPGKRPTLDEKARKLLEADVEERPFAKLRHRQEYLHKAAGVSVSESTLSRVIRSMGFGRKKGRWVRVSATSS